MLRLLFLVFYYCVAFFLALGVIIFFDKSSSEDKTATIKVMCRNATEIFGWDKLCDRIGYPFKSRTPPRIGVYQLNSVPLDYRKSMLGQIKTDQLTYFEGEIIQSIDRKSFLVATRRYGDEDFSGDNIFIEFSSKKEILKGDIVRFYARYNGTLTYKALLGNEVEVPNFFGDYYEIKK